MRTTLLIPLLPLLTILTACNPSKPQPPAASPSLPGTQPASLTLTSPDFSPNSPIPQKYTADGNNLSPALAWSDPPPGAIEFALIVDDPDAPSPDPWVHWVLYKIPQQTRSLPENLPKEPTLVIPPAAMQGKTSWEDRPPAYFGPEPPPGKIHHYHFTIYALDHAIDPTPNMTKSSLLSAINGHVLAQGQLIGTYQRP